MAKLSIDTYLGDDKLVDLLGGWQWNCRFRNINSL